MLAGQAIASNAMDFMSTPSINKKSNNDSNASELKGSLSFDKLLSRTAVTGRTLGKYNSSRSRSSDVSMQKSVKNSNDFSQKSLKTKDVAGKLMSNNTKSNQLNKTSQPSKTKSDSVFKKVTSVLNNVKEEVMETLDLTEEELVTRMQTLGLGIMDLLNPDTLKILLLDQAGITDPSMLLTEDGLGQQLHQLLTNVNEMVEEANITMDDISRLDEDPAELQKLMELMNGSSSSVTKDVMETKHAVVNPQELNASETKDTKESSDESNIQFTVVKEDNDSKETSTSMMSSDSDQSNSNGEYKTESAMANQFLDNLINASSNVSEASFSENLREIHEIRDIANQVIDQIKLTIKPTQTSMDFTLNPEHLGKVALNITAKNGVLTASFTTQNEVTKEAIESQIQVLKDNLSNQGIKVDAIEVTVSDFGFRQESNMGQESSQQQNGSSQSKRPFRMNADEELVSSQPKDSQEQAIIDSGNNIDYSA